MGSRHKVWDALNAWKTAYYTRAAAGLPIQPLNDIIGVDTD